MYNAGRSPFLHKPREVSDIDKTFFGGKDAMLVSGGTHVMSHALSYPEFFALNIVDLGDGRNSRFLSNYVKRLDFIEVDSNVRLNALFEDASIPEVVKMSLMNGIPYSVMRCASIGGTIFPDTVIYDLSAALVSVSSVVLIHRVEKGRAFSEQVLLETLCSRIANSGEDGDAVSQATEEEKAQYERENRIFIEKLFIPRPDNKDCRSFFKSYGNSFFSPEKSIVVAGNYILYENIDQIVKVNLVVCYADKGCYMFHDTMQAMNNARSQYISSQGARRMRSIFESELEKLFADDPRNKQACYLLDEVIEGIQVRLF